MRSCLPWVKGIAAVALILHGSLHLLMPEYWDGTSPLLSGILEGDALSLLVNVLPAAIVFGYVIAVFGLFKVPVARRVWMPSAVIASIASLSLFAIMLNATSGIDCWVAGLVTSIAVLIAVPVLYLKRRSVDKLASGARTAEGAP